MKKKNAGSIIGFCLIGIAAGGLAVKLMNRKKCAEIQDINQKTDKEEHLS